MFDVFYIVVIPKGVYNFFQSTVVLRWMLLHANIIWIKLSILSRLYSLFADPSWSIPSIQLVFIKQNEIVWQYIEWNIHIISILINIFCVKLRYCTSTIIIFCVKILKKVTVNSIYSWTLHWQALIYETIKNVIIKIKINQFKKLSLSAASN